MRILQIITLSELGGAQSVIANLSNRLVDNNEVIVAAGEGDGKLYDMLDNRIVKEHIPSLVRKISPVNELKTIMEMRRLYRKFHPDIIHLHSSKAGLLGRIAFPKSKTVYTVHGFDSIRTAFRKFLPLEKALQYKCSAIVGVSKYDENNLRAEGIKRNVSCIYNGISEPEKLTTDPFATYRQKYKGIILTIARLSPQKKWDMFVEIASKMPDYAFLWIGNQHEYTESHSSNCFFLGNMSNAGSYIEYADLFWLPSNYEGLPIVILEAFANGCPVVASKVGGIPEILDGKNGFAVENDSEMMTDRISYLMENDEIRHKMGEEARKRYDENFNIDKMTEGYLKIYKNLLRN